jgi:hypothetical protein
MLHDEARSHRVRYWLEHRGDSGDGDYDDSLPHNAASHRVAPGETTLRVLGTGDHQSDNDVTLEDGVVLENGVLGPVGAAPEDGGGGGDFQSAIELVWDLTSEVRALRAQVYRLETIVRTKCEGKM